MKITIKTPNVVEQFFSGVDHEKVKEQFEGQPIFRTIMSFNDVPGLVYYVASPNRDKGHKDFFILLRRYDPVTNKYAYYVSGRDLGEIKNTERMRLAIYCDDCQDLVISLTRHNYQTCSCEKVFIDGGEEYSRHSLSGQHIMVDLLQGLTFDSEELGLVLEPTPLAVTKKKRVSKKKVAKKKKVTAGKKAVSKKKTKKVKQIKKG